MRVVLLVLLLACVVPFAGASGNAVDALVAELAPVKQLQGRFVQRQYTPEGTLLAESSGRFRLLRPGYFSWEILSPDRQLIVADPSYIWHYDLDLETATRRPVAVDGEWTPFQILGGDTGALRERFRVEQVEKGIFLLFPLAPDTGFKQLKVSLDGARLTGMEIVDNLDQRVVIDFTDLDSESALASSDFEFTPPAGADTFYYDQ